MSVIIADAAVRGARRILDNTESAYSEALAIWGSSHTVGFPNTAYYLPIAYLLLGLPIEKLSDMREVISHCKSLIPKEEDTLPQPTLDQALDAGLASVLAQELIEALRYLNTPGFYTQTENSSDEQLWLGAADDIAIRKRGVELVDGSTPGFAVVIGSSPDPETATSIASELQRNNLLTFICGKNHETSFAEQLLQKKMSLGWTSRLVPFGPESSAVVFALGFAARVAMSFGKIKPGDQQVAVDYIRNRVLAFAIALGEANDELYANAAGALYFGIPIVSDSAIPEIPPACEPGPRLVTANVPHDRIVSKAIDIRGIKTSLHTVPIPIAYGPAYEGERVRGDNIYLECGGGRTQMVELCASKPMEEIDDGKIEVIGPDISDIVAGDKLPMAIMVEVAGRNMQEDYEPILERQFHHLINYGQGIMHIGQRDIAWLRVSKQAVEKGFKLRHLGDILYAKLRQDFERIVDKLQVKIYTNHEDVQRMLTKARAVYAIRDPRIEGMTDNDTDVFYSCTLCQSFAPSHVCVITPERAGLCGSYNWMDCKASYEINPNGPNQPIVKGATLDSVLGQWQGVNQFLHNASRGKLSAFNSYSIISTPATACGCMECIACIMPMCNGIMTVNREYTGMTPSGMKFTTLASTIGGGLSTPGFIGHSKYNLSQRRFLSAEGGIKRLVWMPQMLKEEISERFNSRASEIGIPDLLDRIADESVGITEEEILPFLSLKEHPALTMDSLM